MEEGTFFSSIWQQMVSVHGQCGSGMVVQKAQFDVFFHKVQPMATMVELQISVLRWVRPFQHFNCFFRAANVLLLFAGDVD